jgi:hypothetical protein
MKKISFLILLITGSLYLFSQGTLQVSSGGSIRSDGKAWITLEDMNLENNGEVTEENGEGGIKFTGESDAHISGKGRTIFNNLQLAKTGSSRLHLEKNISILGTLDFAGGRLNLGNNIVDLSSSGLITGESESSNAYTTGNGFLQSIRNLDHPVNENPGNLGAIISSSSRMGMTIVRRGHQSQDNLEGSNSILRYFEIAPSNNANLNATVQFRYLESELNQINEGDLAVWKSSKWERWTSVGADSRNSSGNFIEKKGINSFGRWTLSTNANEIKQILLVWPNPVRDKAQLTISSTNTSTIQLQLYDSKGSLLSVHNRQLLPGKNNLQLDMKDRAQGIYTLRANIDGKNRIIKLNKM